MKSILVYGLLMITTIVIIASEKEISPVTVDVIYNTPVSTKTIEQALKEAQEFTLESRKSLNDIEANIPLYAAQKEKNFSDLKALVDRTEELYEKLCLLIRSHEEEKKSIDQLNPSLQEINKSLKTITDQTHTLASHLDSNIFQSISTTFDNPMAPVQQQNRENLKEVKEILQTIKSETITTDQSIMDNFAIIKTTFDGAFQIKFKAMMQNIEQQQRTYNQTMQAWMEQTQLFTTLSVAILALTASFWVWWHAHKI